MQGGLHQRGFSQSILVYVYYCLSHLAVTVMLQPDFTSWPENELMLSTWIVMGKSS